MYIFIHINENEILGIHIFFRTHVLKFKSQQKLMTSNLYYFETGCEARESLRSRAADR